MKVDKNGIEFENQRDRDIFLELMREVQIGELRPETIYEAMQMLEAIQKGVAGR